MALSRRRSSQGRALHQRRAWWEVWALLKGQQVRKKSWPREISGPFKEKTVFLISQHTVQTQISLRPWLRQVGATFGREQRGHRWKCGGVHQTVHESAHWQYCGKSASSPVRIVLFKNNVFCSLSHLLLIHYFNHQKNVQVKRDSGPNKQWARASRDCPISSAEGLHSHQTGWLFLF